METEILRFNHSLLEESYFSFIKNEKDFILEYRVDIDSEIWFTLTEIEKIVF
jgi:hypothetical protein